MCVCVGRWVGKSTRTHKDKEERKASVEPWCLHPKRISRVSILACHLCGVGNVGSVCVERWDEGAAEGEPEGAWRAKKE